jgi:MFS family permease
MGHRRSDPADPRPTLVRYFVLVWLCLAAAISYVCRNSLAVAEKTIRQDLGLQDTHFLGIRLTPEDQMGWVMGAFFLTYAAFQLPTGWLGHVWGSRRCLPLFSALWSLASALLGVAPGWLALAGARLGMGAAQSGIFPSCTGTIARWFPPTGRALPSGALASFMSVGGAFGTYLTGVLLEYYGPSSWRWVFVAYSLPGLLWAAAFYLWFRDDPRDHPSVNAGEVDAIGAATAPRAVEREPTPWLAILTSPAMWWICGQQVFRAAGYIFFASWFPTYLQETRDVSTAKAGLQASLPLLAVVLGSVSGGAFSDAVLSWTGSRRLARQGVAVTSLLLCAALTLWAWAIDHAWGAVLVISAGSFFAAVAGPCSYTITIDMGGKHVPTVFSLMNMAGNIGALGFPVFVPWLVRVTGSWDAVLLAFALMFVAAAVFWLLINTRGTVIGQALVKPRESPPCPT